MIEQDITTTVNY